MVSSELGLFQGLNHIMNGVQELFVKMMVACDKTITLLAVYDREDSAPVPKNFPRSVLFICMGATCMAVLMIYVKIKTMSLKNRGREDPQL